MAENGLTADLVLRGGRVHVLDIEDTRATAVAVTDGRIVAVGEDTDIAPLIGAATEVVELDGRAVLPGINDAHLHASWLGALWPRTVFGAPHEPTTEPLSTTREQRRAALLRAAEVMSSLGITSYTEPGIGPGEDDGPTGCFGSEVLEVYRELAAKGALRQRVTLLLLFGLLDGTARTADVLDGITAADTTTADPRSLRIAGLKVFADGIPPMRGAYIHGTYVDGGHGELLLDGADDEERERRLHEIVRAAQRAGLQIAVHATGDRSIDVFVHAVGLAQDEHPADLRHYLVHADLLRDETIPALVRQGMGATLQAGIAEFTAEWAGSAFAGDDGPAMWPLAHLIRAGAPFTLSSDAPVMAPDWRAELAAADRLLGAASDPVARLHDLLRRVTAVPAWQDHAEDWKGTVEVGKVADLVILSEDPDDVGAQGLPDIRIERTYLGGTVVFDAATTSVEA
ncbi:amidohydrolase [Microbacterium sp. NPDC057659]|uniref:amidohydrolase n=1 Tax=Microbacterium sp. NPDC057659 TaxID=3346198 RepID=UPI00366D65F9